MSCANNSSNVNETFIIEPFLAEDIYTTGTTLIGKTIYFNRTDILSAYTADLSSFSTTDIYVTGGTYSNGIATFNNNSGGTFSVTGFSTSTATAFTGGTVTGATIFTNGLTASTISANTISLPYTSGSTLFVGPTGEISQNNSQFFWDNVNNRLGLGTTAPTNKLTVSGSANITGNLTVGGNLAASTFSSILPATSAYLTIGNTSSYWGTLYATTFNSPNTLTLTSANNIVLNAGGTEAGRIFNNGNVSIGTSIDSGFKLDVSGNSRIQGGLTATTINASNISGTTNYVSKFTGANSLGNSVVYDNGTNVGIGTTSPTAKLHVSTVNGTESSIILGQESQNRWKFKIPASSTSLVLGDVGGDYVYFLSSGNIGIGTSTPSYKLDVSGTTRLNGLQTFQGTTASDTAPLGSELLTTGTSDASWTGSSFALGYTHITGSTTTLTQALSAIIGIYYQITYTITGRTSGSITIDFGGVSNAGITSTNASGPIATTTGTLVITPTTDFNGTLVLSIKTIGVSVATTTYTNSNGTTVNEIRANTSQYNTFIGVNSGRRNTTGLYNIGLGHQTIQSNTTGSNNLAIGPSSMAFNTTGYFNTAIGTNALYSNITGVYNTAIGVNTLFNNVAGNNNVVIGIDSGRFIADKSTAATNISTSILIGNITSPLANSQTNQIVIGHQSTGLGSNTTVLGNSSTITSAIYGNLLLGTTVDGGAKLQVSGTVTPTSTVARGASISPILTATANGDTLVGLDINPTFTTGALTGVTNAGLRVSGNILPSAHNLYSLGTNGTRFKDGYFNGTLVGVNFYASNLSFASTDLGIYNSIGNAIGKWFGTGNLALQAPNATPPTDAGYRLDVSGTTRITGTNATPLLIERTGGGNSNMQFKNTGISFFAGVTQFNSFAIGNINNDLGTNAQFSIFPTTGNVVIQNGGTPVDTGYRLDVSGTTRLNGQTTISGTTSAITNLAQGVIINPTLVATANNDVLVGMDIDPTFSTGTFTGVTSGVTRFNGTTQGFIFADYVANNSVFALYPKVVPTLSNYLLRSDGTNLVLNSPAASNMFFTLANSGVGRFYGNGNFGISNNGTFIENGANFQVNGSNTASTNLARAASITNNLISTANNDALVGLDIAPNYVGGVGTTNTIVGGSSYTGTSYAGVPLTGGTGTGAIATVFINPSGVVSAVTITTAGSGYYLGNVLGTSGTTLGTVGSGFNLTINTLSTGTSVKPMGLRVDGIPIGRGGGYVSGNFAMGIDALRNNTIGINNIGIGLNTLLQNSNGSQNIAIGNYSLQNNQNSQNTSIGYASLISLSNGSANTSIGNNAGRYIANGSTPATNINNSIFIGLNAFPLADTQTNQIVIGTSSTGLGSNTTVLGNSSTITTAIYGDLLLGTTSDSGTEKLQVVGSAKISHTGATPLIIERTSSSTNTNIQFKNDVNSLFIGQMDNSNIGIGPSQNLVASSQLTVFGNTGNVIIQNGGTPVDTGYRLDVSGTTRLNGQTRISGTTSAITNLAQGVIVNPTLVATANNDVLVGMDINTNYVGGVGSVNTIVGGSSYTGTSYTGVPLTGGTGTGAIATIFINPSGAVSAVTITTAGSGYYLGNVLGTSGTTLGTVGSGFNLTVNTLSKTGVKPIGLRVDGINIGRGGGYNNTNTAVGNGAGLTNTTGNQNTFIGYIAGLTNTTGVQNTALGASALYFNVGGNSNTAIGANTLSANVTGFQNTSIGSTSLSLLTSGANNISLGFTSGRYIADGTTSLLNSNTSIFIGDFTKALASSQTNQIVIGHNSTGLGSNTTVLGNSSTVTTAIYGRTLLGTTTDNGSSILQVQGTTTSDGPTLGTELATTATGTNWVGTSFALGYDHTTGSTVALTSTLAAVIGAYYQIAYTITGRTAGSITINFGGASNSNISATSTWGPLATTTGVLTITPTTDFDGTLVLSVKSQTSTSVATTTFTNSSGTVVNEIRNASSNTNLFIGLNSGRRVTTSVANTFIGFSTGSNNTTGTNNTFIGQASGTLNSIGSYNLFVGQASGQANTLGNSDTFVGQNAGYNNTSGGNNAFFGASAGYNNTSAYYNTFIGDSSGLNNTVGSSNTFIGQGAGASNTTGGSNVLLGANTGGGNTAGASNVILGASAGRYIADKTTSPTSINTSILIGNRTSPLANTQTNQIVIGNDSTGLGSNTTVLGNSSTITTAIYGDLLLGTTIDSGVEKLQVQGTAGMTAVKIIGSGNSTTPPIFTVQGSQGELFSVNDSLTGSLFSVNDISGLPILEVFSDNTVLMGSYIAPSLNTTTKVTAGVGLTSVYSIPTSAYTGAFFDYTISDNTNLRAGNVMAIWNSGTTVQYTETSTNDIGNTSGLTFNMIISGSTAILRTSGVTGNWTVKTIIRSI